MEVMKPGRVLMQMQMQPKEALLKLALPPGWPQLRLMAQHPQCHCPWLNWLRLYRCLHRKHPATRKAARPARWAKLTAAQMREMNGSWGPNLKADVVLGVSDCFEAPLRANPDKEVLS
jgi:hypothetical protein